MKPLLKFAALIFLTTGLCSYNKISDYKSCPYKSNQVSYYSTDVLDKWMATQIRLMSTTMASFNGPFVRIYSYSSIAAYESVLPGISQNSSFLITASAFNNFPTIPEIDHDKKYHWPSSLNAAMATMTRSMFAMANLANKSSIDSLENELITIFNRETDPATIERSVAFGKKVAQIIFEWGETDGYRQANKPYNPPSGPGKWIPTPPGFAKAVTPYWGSLRTMVTGSIIHTQPPPPPPYSEDTASEFYKMIKQVYDVDQHLTPEEKDIVSFWRDINPGITAPGHWLNVLRQVFQKEKNNIRLDKAAFVYALTGIALNDAWIGCWKTRYEYNLLRPVTYIQNVMGNTEWLPLLPTPPHPEYTSGFACMAGAVCQVLTAVFGNNYPITDHTYDSYGMKPRSFKSFLAMAKEAGDSKFYGGIHYKLSVDMGMKQGVDVAKNIVAFLLQKEKSAKP